MSSTKFSRSKGQAPAFVAYYRVSTQRQGRSGLGLEAQTACVASHIEAARGVLVAAFTEVESGNRDERPELRKALQAARSAGAVLIVAKLDRLSRSVRFIHELKESGVQFVACDLPDFNTLTLGIFATFAQHERERISERTKAALDAKRQALGEWRVSNLSEAARTKGHERNRFEALRNSSTRQAAAFVLEAWEGPSWHALSLRAKAERLNAGGFLTPKGGAFTAVQVSRLEARCKQYGELARKRAQL